MAFVGEEYEAYRDDDLPTRTSREQIDCEDACAAFLNEVDDDDDVAGVHTTTLPPVLLREAHLDFLRKGIGRLPAGYCSLDARSEPVRRTGQHVGVTLTFAPHSQSHMARLLDHALHGPPGRFLQRHV